jgi:hypothetical protein
MLHQTRRLTTDSGPLSGPCNEVYNLLLSVPAHRHRALWQVQALRSLFIILSALTSIRLYFPGSDQFAKRLSRRYRMTK